MNIPNSFTYNQKNGGGGDVPINIGQVPKARHKV